MKPTPTLRDWTTRYLRLIQHAVCRAVHDDYQTLCKQLETHFGDVSISAVDPGGAADFIAGMDVAATTRARKARMCRSIFKRAVNEGVLKANPFASEKVTAKAADREWPTLDAPVMDKILAACPNEQWRLLFGLCRYAGLRSGEARALGWDQIGDTCITLIAPKTGKRRQVPIEERMAAMLVSTIRTPPGPCYRLPGTGHGLSHGASVIINRAGLSYPKPLHSLRKACAREWRRAYGESVAALALGHSVTTAAAYYDQLSPADIAKVNRTSAA